MIKTVGVVAGIGRLPIESVKALKSKNDIRVVAFAVLPETDRKIAEIADAFYDVNIADMMSFFQTMKAEGVSEVIIIGKVTKELLFHKGGAKKPDGVLQSLLGSLPNLNDDTIMLAIVTLFERSGIKVLDQTEAIKFLLPEAGIMTERKPSEQERADMDFAYEMAKASGKLDIGQTVVVKNKAVMAVEAVEGTNECIKRGGFLAGAKGAVVGKTAKPNQDFRFDVPTVGAETIKAMIESGVTAIVMEAGKTFLVEKDEVLQMANAGDIVIEVK